MMFSVLPRLLERANLPVKAPASMDFDCYMKHMMRDKKVLSGQLRLVLPTSIGSAEVVADVPHDILRRVINLKVVNYHDS